MLNSVELTFQAGQFRCLCIVAIHHERCRPKHDDRCIVATLSLVLLLSWTPESSFGDTRRFSRQLGTGILLVLERGGVSRRDVLGPLSAAYDSQKHCRQREQWRNLPHKPLRQEGLPGFELINSNVWSQRKSPQGRKSEWGIRLRHPA